jgi:hypothetical protein
VEIVVDGQPFPALYGMDRPDVVDYLKQPAYMESGYLAEVPAEAISPGAHRISIRVVNGDRACYYTGPDIALTAR